MYYSWLHKKKKTQSQESAWAKSQFHCYYRNQRRPRLHLLFSVFLLVKSPEPLDTKSQTNPHPNKFIKFWLKVMRSTELAWPLIHTSHWGNANFRYKALKIRDKEKMTFSGWAIKRSPNSKNLTYVTHKLLTQSKCSP